jgi:hypothetical protein
MDKQGLEVSVVVPLLSEQDNVGAALTGTLFIVITFNDIIRVFFK